MIGSAVLCALLAVLGLAFFLYGRNVAVFVVAAAFAIGTAYQLHIVSTFGAAAVDVSDAGIRAADARLVHWNEVATARERSFSQRLELLGYRDEVLARVEYQLDDVEDILEIIRRHLRPPDPARDTFGRRRTRIDVFVMIGIAIIVVLGFLQSWWMGIGMLVFVFAVWRDMRHELAQLTIAGDEVILRTWLRSETIARDSVTAVMLALEPIGDLQRRLVVALQTSDGRGLRVSPRGQNAVEVYRALHHWHAR
jgi:hypothetical protein